MATTVQTGKVKWFNEEKYYGFITRDDGSEIFFHGRDVASGHPLNTDDNVSFVEAKGQPGKGPKAVQVSLVRRAV